jgi:predicted CoA-binding protein
MARAQASQDAIHEFLAQKRIAMIGVSRDGRDFTRYLFRELLRYGYDVVPVQPNAAEIEGRRCFACVEDVRPPVDGAIIVTPARITASVVRDCIAAGIRLVWMHRGVGPGAASEEAVALCRDAGIRTVAGACPLMFLPQAGFIHRFHGFFAARRAYRRACGEGPPPLPPQG